MHALTEARFLLEERLRLQLKARDVCGVFTGTALQSFVALHLDRLGFTLALLGFVGCCRIHVPASHIRLRRTVTAQGVVE
eukprot:EC713090.1.p2 GENE.EC713090.1~~EC713090.1.p2  ORF type:complete len:80 (+),score=4.33 EC713090.1:91-330(+)